jgi:hypothetical protein
LLKTQSLVFTLRRAAVFGLQVTVVAVFINLALTIAADRRLRRRRTGVGKYNLPGRAGGEKR